MRLLLVWLLNALALLGVAYLLPGIQIDGFAAALIAALILGLVNTIIRPILVVLTFPITVVTLGIFYLVINALLFWGVSKLMGNAFVVNGFWSAMLGTVVYSIIAWMLSLLLPTRY